MRIMAGRARLAATAALLAGTLVHAQFGASRPRAEGAARHHRSAGSLP